MTLGLQQWQQIRDSKQTWKCLSRHPSKQKKDTHKQTANACTQHAPVMDVGDYRCVPRNHDVQQRVVGFDTTPDLNDRIFRRTCGAWHGQHSQSSVVQAWCKRGASVVQAYNQRCVLCSVRGAVLLVASLSISINKPQHSTTAVYVSCTYATQTLLPTV